MSYSVEKAATDLMLDPDELKEILEAFFEDAPGMVERGRRAMESQDWENLARSMHSLKGAAFNMRMDVLGELAEMAEKAGQFPRLRQQELLQEIETELKQLAQDVRAYYK